MFTNKYNVPLPLAVWLADSDYDFNPQPNSISATSILNPIKSIVLGRKAFKTRDIDVTDVLAARIGTSVHLAAEKAWRDNLVPAMTNLGFAESFIKNVEINPKVQDDKPTVYIELRTNKELNGYTVSGKFDFVIDGELHDIKTTRVFNYQSGNNNIRYAQQGSIYRWLNPDIIWSNYVHINYLFLDWSSVQAAINSEYPQAPIVEKKLPLMSVQDTEEFLAQRIDLIKSLENKNQEELPECTPKELWMGESKWAFYADPKNTSRATKLFTSYQDAMVHNSQKGGKGLILERRGEPKFCHYCAAKSICKQFMSYSL